MPISATVVNTPFDSRISQTIARFTSIQTNTNLVWTGPAWNGIEVVLQSGSIPSHATVQISLSVNNDERMPSLTCINTSAINLIKVGDFCAIYSVVNAIETLVFTGYVGDINQNLTKDIIVVTLNDHRKALDDCPVIGAFIADAQGYVTYAQDAKPIMNWNNLPNCTLGTDPSTGAIFPCFTSPELGLKPGDLIYTGNSTTAFTPVKGKACYWSVKLAWQYFYFAGTSVFAASKALENGMQAIDQDFAYPQVDKKLIWPAGLESALVAPSNGEVNSERKCITMDFTGQTYLNVLSNLAMMNGQFALNCIPTSSTTGTLEIVPSLPAIDNNGQTVGQTLTRYVAGNVQNQTNKGVSGGSYNILGTKVSTRQILTGNTVFIETRIPLIEDWGDADETGWGTEFKNLGNFEQEFNEANRAHPGVFCWYRLDPTALATIQLGTTEAESSGNFQYPLANVGRPILQSLLSSFLADPKNAQGQNIPLVGLMNAHFPIFFEVNYLDTLGWPDIDPVTGLSAWLKTSTDDFTIEANGRIRLDGLRNASITGTGTFKYGPPTEFAVGYVGDAIRGKIRLTCAIPLDHSVRSALRLASDTGAPFLPVQASPDSARIANSYSRTAYENLGGEKLYDYWIRHNSYPTGKETPPGLSSQIRMDYQYLDVQAKIRANQMLRIPKGGEIILPYIITSYKPGITLKDINNIGTTTTKYNLDAIINRVTFTFGSQESTALGLG